MPRKRNYAAEYRARQAKARREGYEGYYGKRVRAGKPPSAPKPTGQALRRARGHAASSDLRRDVKSGRVAVMIQEPQGERDEKGRYPRVKVTVQLTDGEQRSYWLQGKQLEGKQLNRLRDALQDAGVDVYLNPSLDVLRIRAGVEDADLDEVEDADLDEVEEEAA